MRKSNSDRPSDENNDSLQTQRERLLALAKQEGYEIVPRVKACAYLRVGVGTADLTEQDIGIQTQRERLLSLAEKEGYEIVESYVDEGFSGADPKRPAWCKLLSDAATAAWVVVLCLNRTRFSRLDHIENSLAIHTLRDAGKKIHTAVEGLLEWHTTAGQIIDKMIDAEEGVTPPIVVDSGEKPAANPTTPKERLVDVINAIQHRYHVEQLARRSLEGQLRAFQEGRRIFGTCPYGYACVITDPRGNTHRLARTENCLVPKGWMSRLVPGDPKEIEVVQWLFAEYATKDVAFRWLAQELNAKGVPAPQGEAWPASAIVRLLANDAYVGDTRFGRRGTGKFYRLDGDKVVKVERNAPVKRQEGLVRQNTHEGIISRQTWDLVQAKLNRPSKKE